MKKIKNKFNIKYCLVFAFIIFAAAACLYKGGDIVKIESGRSLPLALASAPDAQCGSSMGSCDVGYPYPVPPMEVSDGWCWSCAGTGGANDVCCISKPPACVPSCGNTNSHCSGEIYSDGCSGSCAGTGYCAPEPYCGDGSCDSGENCANCSTDCGDCCSPEDATLSGWGACSKTCGGGTQTRTCSGASCGGDATCGGAPLSQACNIQSCDNGCAAITSECTTCWNSSAWVSGTVSCGTACVSGSCAVDNGCAAETLMGQACWNSYMWVSGTKNTAPAVSGMTAPNWSHAQAGANALRANLKFDFIDIDAGSYGSAYQIIVRKADDTLVLNTGKCSGYYPSTDCKIEPAVCMENGLIGCINPGDCVCHFTLDQGKLEYGASYKWSVMVWDNNNAPSALTAYSAVSDTDNNDGAAETFTAYKHKMPQPVFSHFPDKPSRGEQVKFISKSKVYFSSDPGNPIDCLDNQCVYLWTATTGVSINNATASDPIITFNSTGDATVTLKVTDSDGYYAIISDVVNVVTQLPKWQEVKPD